MATSVTVAIEWLGVPLDSADLRLAVEARELHRVQTDQPVEGSVQEFPSDHALTTTETNPLGLYVAHDGDDLVGYLSVADVDEQDWWHLVWMIVRSDRQGRGIGTQLLARCAADAQESHASLLILEPLSDPGWEDLIRYYEARGFTPETQDDQPGGALTATPSQVVFAIQSIERP